MGEGEKLATSAVLIPHSNMGERLQGGGGIRTGRKDRKEQHTDFTTLSYLQYHHNIHIYADTVL
jgi:hypothetical protein